jgi:hypothetical protein
MAIESQDPATQTSGSETSIEKFKTAEDRDKAYTELEKLSYSQTQRLAELEKKLDHAMEMQQQAAAPVDNRSFTDMYPSREAQDKRETELASRILTNPSRVLQEHAESVRQQTLREVSQLMATQNAIARFQTKNPDLANHEDLVTIYVRKQPESLSPSERLDRAGQEVRKYLGSIVKGNNQQSQDKLDPSTYVESPTSQPSGTASAPAAAPSQEDDLTEMIRERNALQAKKRL